MARKIRNNDEVIIIAGKDKGRHGVVIKVVSSSKIVVKDINMAKKHQKSIPDKNQIGGIIKKELPIHVSNVKIFNKQTKKSDRVGFKIKNGKKVRFYKSNHEILDLKGE